MDNLYDILLVSQTAKKEEIRKAYRQLAAQYHPDRNPDPAATEKFRQITKAYEVLGDEERRKLYDRYGDIALNPNFKGFVQPLLKICSSAVAQTPPVAELVLDNHPF